MALTKNETIEILPLFIRRDLGRLAEVVQRTRSLSRAAKIETLNAITQLSFNPDDPDAMATVFKTLGI